MNCLYSLCLTIPLPFHPEPTTTGLLPLTHKPLALALSGHQGLFIAVALSRSWLLLLHPLAAFSTVDYSSGIYSPLDCLDTPLMFFLFPLWLVFLLCWFLISPNSKQSTSGHCISSLSTHFKYHPCGRHKFLSMASRLLYLDTCWPSLLGYG